MYFKRLKNTRNYEPVVRFYDFMSWMRMTGFFDVRAVRPNLSIRR
ncbi:hypothetical protein BACI71_20056 [Bacillus mycoides]|uniref:Uncharacterized protein n=1 Tax=Bacillus mycoides TaxID=1405 RepID=A0A653V5E7_BACMY|nr:hypothetical protein BACI71_20056 [Bacillus mycoides]